MMKKLAFLTLILVFLAGGVMGCIDQSVPEIPAKEEMGYIQPGNETATDFYSGLGYDINEYKTGGLTEPQEENKGVKAVNVKSGDSEAEVITYKSKAANNTAVTYGKEADGYINYKDCIYDVVVTGDGDKFTNNMIVSDGEITENGSRYTAPKTVKGVL
jgi:hypothetical protein